MPIARKTTKEKAPLQPRIDPKAVYKLVKKIPHGQVATYGQLAALLGWPRHARHVGYALSATPATVKIPWHRVINSQGRVSLRVRNWDSGSDDYQRILLEAEGVVFIEGKINLRKYRWMPAEPRSRRSQLAR